MFQTDFILTNVYFDTSFNTLTWLFKLEANNNIDDPVLLWSCLAYEFYGTILVSFNKRISLNNIENNIPSHSN